MQKGGINMDFLTDRIKPIYFKYLSASFGTAMIASIYSIVDVAMVGQYQGAGGNGGAGRRCTGLEHHL